MMGSLRDLLPIILVIAFFQLFVLQQPIPNMFDLLLGTFFVVLGLTFFIYGLEMGLFPIGESDRKSTRLNSSHRCISYAVFCLKKKT